ncbi:MAG: dihydroorotate dehydrogenase [Planctomycetia bacterium]|nr:dihydroorotate dehydrogenase [Planctomycetia bacterium]
MSHPARPCPPPSAAPDLAVTLGRLRLPNPIMVASGTFGYGREMAGFVPLERLGGVVPKTITPLPRKGNVPWRTVETSAGLLNSIGLDNDGVESFLAGQLPWLVRCGAPVIVSIAGASQGEFVRLAERLDGVAGIAALELNISCPNVSHGVDLGTDAAMCRGVVDGVRRATRLPVLAKLTPNVTDIASIAAAARDGGADAVTLVNTCQGIAVDWRRRRPMLGNVVGGLSGPAIKPIALRCVHQVRRAVDIPIVGVGGIMSIDDCMEFFVTGATAVQVGTANFAEPVVSTRLLDALPGALAEIGAARMEDVIGTLQLPQRSAAVPAASAHGSPA